MAVIIIVFVILSGIFIKLHSKHKKPLRAAVGNMVLGTASLLTASILLSVKVNMFTMFISLTLGVPGTILVVLGTVFLKSA